MVLRWSEEDFNKYIKDKKGNNKNKVNKYHNKKTEFKGERFDSKKELKRFLELETMLKAGEIEHLERQPEFILIDTFKDNQNITERKVKYIADFMYIINGRVYVEDVKSDITRKDSTYIIKRKLFKVTYPDYIFIENI